MNEKYIQNKIERDTITTREILNHPRLFESFLISHEDKQEKFVETRAFRIIYQFENLPEEIDPFVSKFLREKPHLFRKLKEFVIQSKDIDYQWQLSEEAPDLDIYFEPDGADVTDAGAHIMENAIRVGSNLDNWAGLLTLLHEIGHKKDPGYLKLPEKSLVHRNFFKTEDKIMEQTAKYILQDERNAWSYTLKKLKPFLYMLPKDDLHAYIHEWALGSYSDSIMKKTGMNLEEEIVDEADALLDNGREL